MDCFTCDEKLREERGHDKEGIIPFMVDGKRVFRCPLTFITPLSWEYIKAFYFYKNGYLPNGKGWLDESSKFTQAMMSLSNIFNKAEKEETERLKSGTRNVGRNDKHSN